MAFSLVWSLGYLISIIVFSTVIGLIFYFNEISNKALAKYLVVSVICTSAVIYVISIFKNQLYSAIGVYNYTFLFLIAFVLIFIGYILSREDIRIEFFTGYCVYNNFIQFIDCDCIFHT